MYGPMKDELSAKIAALKEEGLYKAEAPLTSPQSGKITVDDGLISTGIETIDGKSVKPEHRFCPELRELRRLGCAALAFCKLLLYKTRCECYIIV